MPAKSAVVVVAAIADVIAALLDGGGIEEAAYSAAVWLLVNPDLDRVEHSAVDLDQLVPECRVVEDAEDIAHHLFDWHSWIFPGIQDPSAA